MTRPIIHQTDLFHPHADPDDHWDLACQFALAAAGQIDLRGILIDYPPKHIDCGDPAIAAVSQLNNLAGLAVPCAVGTAAATVPDPQQAMHNSGIRLVLDILRKATEPVAIHVVGSCRDVALAGLAAPDLFREKCRAIYLNAGSAQSDQTTLEYNVELDPFAYHAIFQIPCPIFWMPCFGENGFFQTARFGTYYRFQQSAVLDRLDAKLQQYFIYALEKKLDNQWLTFLDGRPDRQALARCGNMMRNMWCTGGFFHAAGLGVTIAGKLVDLDVNKQDLLYTFMPVRIICAPDGTVEWSLADENTGRFIFCVHDPDSYPQVMTAALGQLLVNLPARPTAAEEL